MAKIFAPTLVQNGAGLNGANYSNGASNGTSNGVVLKADYSDSHSSNGRSATLTDLREAEPVAVLDAAATAARNGNGASPVAVEEGGHAWADPCDVGQLEACAQERYAGVAAGARAKDRCGVVLLALGPPVTR